MRAFVSAAILLALASSASAQPRGLTPDSINQAEFNAQQASASKAISPVVVKAQTLLSRRNVSPGEIDGLEGENYRKAVAQFRRQEKLGEGDQLDEAAWSALTQGDGQPVVIEATVPKEVASYDFAQEIPKDYAKQAELKRLAYVRPSEMLAERFQMSEALLKALNPRAHFDKAGEKIFVVSADRAKPRSAIVRLEANKTTGLLIAYGKDDDIVASYPATIGSDETPSPEGEVKITRIAQNPTYHYDPDKNFKQGRNTEKLTLPPGPNNPVGTVWIALSRPTFGIHGTPEPSKVSKNESHGCVRLTNWDAEQLAKLVKPGLTVRFTD